MAADPALDQKLITAAYSNDVDAARELIEAGADVNAKDETDQSAYLIATSEVGDDTALLELTLANGAEVRTLDSYDGTGLIRAADRGYTTIVARLLETDIEIDHVNRLGLDRAPRGDHPRRWRRRAHGGRTALVEAGVDVNLADGQGVTPLAHAEQQGYDEIAAILRNAGATS